MGEAMCQHLSLNLNKIISYIASHPNHKTKFIDAVGSYVSIKKENHSWRNLDDLDENVE